MCAPHAPPPPPTLTRAQYRTPPPPAALNLARTLNFDFNRPQVQERKEALASVKEDWDKDSGGTGTVTRESFLDSIFEVSRNCNRNRNL